MATRATARYRLLLPLVGGAAVSIALGIYGRVHDPTGHALFTLFFTRTLNLKAWFATVAVLFAVVQVLTAARIYGKIRFPAHAPSWLGDFHRLCGTLAFLFSLPVAFHCLWSLGFNASTSQTRVFVHSVLGCLFYGAFAAKMVIVRSKHVPGWALPLAGSLVFTALVGIWLTSSLWFFTNVGFPAV